MLVEGLNSTNAQAPRLSILRFPVLIPGTLTRCSQQVVDASKSRCCAAMELFEAARQQPVLSYPPRANYSLLRAASTPSWSQGFLEVNLKTSSILTTRSSLLCAFLRSRFVYAEDI